MAHDRDYEGVVARLKLAGDRAARMRAVVDALWEEMSPKGCSWVGFYLKVADAEEMVLGARRDKPACSPIGLFGACGRAWRSRRALIVTDVARLGEGYISCDPRDKSEVVVPCVEALGGECWGVLDADSYEVGAFDERDVAGLTRVLVHMGLTVGDGGAGGATDVV